MDGNMIVQREVVVLRLREVGVDVCLPARIVEGDEWAADESVDEQAAEEC